MWTKRGKCSFGKVLEIYLNQKGTKCTLFAQQHFHFRNVFLKETECRACKVLEIYAKTIHTVPDRLIHLQLPEKFTRSEQLQLKYTSQDINLTSYKVEEAKYESLEQQKQKISKRMRIQSIVNKTITKYPCLTSDDCFMWSCSCLCCSLSCLLILSHLNWNKCRRAYI